MTQSRFALKFTSAAVASGAIVLLGFNQFASAESACGLFEAGRFHEAVTAPTEEASPEYFLLTAETFIDACPDRFEVREAHVIAARASLDTGNAERAVAHYDAALQAGAHLEPSQRMDQAITLEILGKAARAREARNIAIADWLASVDAADVAQMSARRFKNGTIYSVRYTRPEMRSGITALWMAVPAGNGLPIAILIRSAPQQAAWRAIRTGTAPAPLIIAEQLSCRDSVVLGEVTDDLTLDELESGAMGDLRTYLKAPDHVAPTPKDDPLGACFSLNHVLRAPGLTEFASLR
jgi:hypothetical protein